MKKIEHKVILSRILRLLIPLVLLAGIILGSSLVPRTPIGANNRSIYARAVVESVTVDHTEGAPYTGTQKVLVRVTSGQFKGQTCELSNANAYHIGAYCMPGTKIIAMLHTNSDGALSGGSVYNYDRTGMVYLLVGLFAAILLLVGGKKGAAALYALIFTFVCVICVYVPLLYVGCNGIPAGIATAVLILVGSIYILNGWSGKTLTAIIGTTLGVGISGLLAMVVGRLFHLSGYNLEDAEAMVYIAGSTKLDVANILYAGVLISSLGAVMDVSVSIVAAMQEVHEQAPGLSAKELMRSGMRVGRDMMGTMSNTLILAYTGSATSVLLTVYSFDRPYLQMMGYNAIVTEILCGLCGTIGILLTVPLQTAITTLWLKRIKK